MRLPLDFPLLCDFLHSGFWQLSPRSISQWYAILIPGAICPFGHVRWLEHLSWRALSFFKLGESLCLFRLDLCGFLGGLFSSESHLLFSCAKEYDGVDELYERLAICAWIPRDRNSEV